MTMSPAAAHRPMTPFPIAPLTRNMRRVTTHGPARGHRYSITNPTAPADARELVRKHAPATIADDAVIAANELATNALEHAGGADRITLTVTATMLILSVTDRRPDKQLPQTDPALAFDLDAETGRGLALVCALGAALSVRRSAASKRVTARFPIGETS